MSFNSIHQNCDKNVTKTYPSTKAILWSFPVIFSIVPMLVLEALRVMMQVPFRGFEALVAHAPRYGINIDAVLRKPCAERVPQVVEDGVFDSGLGNLMKDIKSLPDPNGIFIPGKM